jgi:hypothetical protein
MVILAKNRWQAVNAVIGFLHEEAAPAAPNRN